MAVTATDGQATNTGSGSAQTLTTASKSWTAGRRLLAFGQAARDGHTQGLNSLFEVTDSGSLTWTELVTGSVNSSEGTDYATQFKCWISSTVTATARTVTIDPRNNGTNKFWMALAVVEIDGSDGTLVSGQSDSATNGSPGGTLTSTLPSSVTTRAFGAYVRDVDNSTTTFDSVTGYSAISSATDATGTQTIGVWESTTTAAFAAGGSESGTAYTHSGIVVELAESATATEISIGQASESDSAQGVTVDPGSVAVSLGQAAEANTGQGMTADPGSVGVSLGQASESDTGQAVTTDPGSVAAALGQAAEADSAQALALVTLVQIALGQAAEVDAGQILALDPGSVAVAFGLAAEADSAQALALSTLVEIAFGQASEVDTGQALSVDPGSVEIAFGQASEVDTGQALALLTLIEIALGQAAEVDTGQAVAVDPGSVSVALGQAAEADSAQAVTVVALGLVLAGVSPAVARAVAGNLVHRVAQANRVVNARPAAAG